jgi:chromosome partitioning protein
MKICLFNAKGGVGRTTLALHLAQHFAKEHPKQRVLLADCDPQGSALAWAALADETPFTVGRNRSPGFDVAIFDMGPRLPDNGVIPDADLYLVPTLLDGVAFVVFLRTVELLKEQGKPFLPVANRVNPYRAEHRMRLASQELQRAPIVRERACLASYYGQGTTAFDMTGRHIKEAQEDIRRLADTIKARIQGRKP